MIGIEGKLVGTDASGPNGGRLQRHSRPFVVEAGWHERAAGAEKFLFAVARVSH